VADSAGSETSVVVSVPVSALSPREPRTGLESRDVSGLASSRRNRARRVGTRSTSASEENQ
jgi:hypothetical protein